jgi:DNA repair exonuclease SbcCD ATPase subunit
MMEDFFNALNEVIKFCISIVPLIGVAIAWLGLNTWRRQIKGTDEYKVASELLTEVYRVREAVQVVRSSFIQYVPKEDSNETMEMNNFLGYVEALDRRWKEVTDPAANLSLLSLKAEVHLGESVKKEVDELIAHLTELRSTYETFLDVIRPGSGFEGDPFEQEARKTLFSKPKNDEFKNRLQATVEKIEKLVRKHI